jgi:hypothetical protein
MAELIKTCPRCEGSGEEPPVTGYTPRHCFVCLGSGYMLGDQIRPFILTLLADEDIYRAILRVAKNLRADIEHS